MTFMRLPSTTLLRAFLKPGQCTTCQTRAGSDFMPRKKYAGVTRLDKLHRQQKATLRKEHLDSHVRANSMQPPHLASQAAPSLKSETANASVVSRPTVSQPSTDLTTIALPYSISRTHQKNLPIYETTKAGGSKHITQLRKLSGDLEALQLHIQEALNLPQSFVDPRGRKKDNVVINRTTRQIIVRGWRGPEIKKWAEMVGF